MKHKKSNTRHILLSVAALLVIALTAFGITYSWIEGGTTYSIQTEKSGDVKTGNAPDTEIFEGLTLSPSNNTDNEISLNQFDKNTNAAQELYFSEVSSADGLNFFFPTAFDASHNATAFRKANSNDYGTKFINYNFDVNVEKKCYLAFSEAPVINVIKDGKKVSDTSAFRMMIKNGSQSYILTTASEEQTSNAVTDIGGTTQTLTAVPANNYIYNEDHTAQLFKYDTGDTDNIEVSVWLDGESATSELLGAEVTVDMNLKALEEIYKIIFDAVTESNSGVVSVSDFTGGKINGGSVKIETEAVAGNTVSATASANTHYTFVGWYSNSECADTDLVTDDNTISQTVEGRAAYYAKFVEDPKYNVSFNAVTYDNNGNKLTNGFTGGVIKEGTTSHATAFTLSKYVNDTVTAIATENTNYTFAGWYSDENCTISVSSANTLSKTVTGDVTYYAKFVEKPKYTVSVDSVTYPATESGGTVNVNGSGTSVTAYQDSTVTINAVAVDGYGFVGWYTDEDCTNEYSTDTSTSVTVGSSNTTYYAKFVQQHNVTLTVKTDGVVGGSGGAVNIGTDVTDGSTVTTITKPVLHGNSVNLYAKANTGYNFVGIYDSSGNYIQEILPFSPQINDDVTYYAHFEKKPDSTTTIYFEDRGFTYYDVWAYSDAGANYSDGEWPGLDAEYDDETGYYKYTFTTSDTGEFKVIVSDNGNNQYPESGSSGLTGEIGGTYLFTADNTLVEFDPSSIITITVQAVTNGTVTVNGGASAKVVAGSTVSLVATPSSGYQFVGWYTNSSCTGTAVSTSASASVTVGSTDTTYYAKFEVEDTTRKIYFTPNSSWKNDSARFACYVWSDSMSGKWYSMSDGDGDGVYSATIDKGYTYIIFCRMNPSTTTNSWDNKWNQTGDLTIPTDGKNHYKKTSSTWDGDTSGTWSTYS